MFSGQLFQQNNLNTGTITMQWELSEKCSPTLYICLAFQILVVLFISHDWLMNWCLCLYLGEWDGRERCACKNRDASLTHNPQDPGEHTWLGLGPRKQQAAVATLSSHAVLLADGPLFHLAKLSHPGRTHFHTHTLEGPCIVAHWVFRNPPYILEDGALNLLPWPLLLLAIITRALLVLPRADLSH